jgi:hypothetical protein
LGLRGSLRVKGATTLIWTTTRGISFPVSRSLLRMFFVASEQFLARSACEQRMCCNVMWQLCCAEDEPHSKMSSACSCISSDDSQPIARHSERSVNDTHFRAAPSRQLQCFFVFCTILLVIIKNKRWGWLDFLCWEHDLLIGLLNHTNAVWLQWLM